MRANISFEASKRRIFLFTYLWDYITVRFRQKWLKANMYGRVFRDPADTRTRNRTLYNNTTIQTKSNQSWYYRRITRNSFFYNSIYRIYSFHPDSTVFFIKTKRYTYAYNGKYVKRNAIMEITTSNYFISRYEYRWILSSWFLAME